MTLTKFAQTCSAGETLTRAVVRQIGGWEEFKERAQDICSHGADGGYSGFIYYSDTVKFYEDHKAEIYSLVHNTSQEFGDESAIAFVKNFACLKESTEEEIGKTLYGGEVDTFVANALAWFALESVSYDYANT